MCGPEVTDRPRGGALAALGPPFDINPLLVPRNSVSGDLAFHTPGSPESIRATHARLTATSLEHARALSSLHVVIHSSGDLTRQTHDCGLFRQFSLASIPAAPNAPFVELPLEKPLLLEVSDEGVIGRRVSLYARPTVGDEFVVAEGIVGFNFFRHTKPSI